MAVERKVTVRVDLIAGGNLGDKLKEQAGQARALQSNVQGAVGRAVGGVNAQAASGRAASVSEQVRQVQEQAAAQKNVRAIKQFARPLEADDEVKTEAIRATREQLKGERANIGSQSDLAVTRQEVALERESLQIEKEKAALRARVNREFIQSPQGRATTQETAIANVQAKREERVVQREESKVANIAEFGQIGGRLKTFGERIEGVSGGLAKAFGVVAAMAAVTSPAVMQTFLGSVQLAAGEIGMIFIPTLVTIAGYFQDLAGIIRTVNDATGGIIGKVLGPILAIGTGAFFLAKAIAFVSPAFAFVQSSLGATAAASQAAAAGLARVAGASSLAGASGAAGGAPGAAAGAGGGGFMGRLLGRAGLAAAGVGLSNAAGEAIGGRAGGVVSNVGTGASIGAAVGSLVPVVGTAVGALIGAGVGLLTSLFESSKSKAAKISMNFQGGAVGLEDMHSLVQRESIRDPMQQAKFEQEARANETLAASISGLERAISGISQSWQTGN